MESRSPSVKYVWVGGIAAGLFDISYAILFWAIKAGVAPRRILQSVAAGLLGRESFNGGWPTALIGLLLHFFIALSMAFTYYAAAKHWPILRDRPVVLGLAYGLVLYLIMNLIVVPLSRAATGSRDPLWIGLSVAVHMVAIGVPIALSARYALR